MLDNAFGLISAASTARGKHVSWWRQAINLFCCALSLPLYFVMTVSSDYPITLDMLTTIMLAELNRFFNEQRRQRFYCKGRSGQDQSSEDINLEKKEDIRLQRTPPGLDCIAAVVGWREDPSLFARAMESYKSARGCAFLLVGIDGDEAEDQEMVNVFLRVR